MDEINLWLNLVLLVGGAIVGFGLWKGLATKAAIATIDLLNKRIDALEDAAKDDKRENEALRVKNDLQVEEIRLLTVRVAEAKASAETCKTLVHVLQKENATILADNAVMKRAMRTLSFRLRDYDKYVARHGIPPVDFEHDPDLHDVINEVHKDDLRAEVAEYMAEKKVLKAERIETGTLEVKDDDSRPQKGPRDG